jgi:tetratricopeptide (TPR) repeat protein
LHKNGSKEEAQKKLDLLIQSDPNDPGPLLAQVQLLVEDGAWDELNETVTQWQQKHPRDSGTALSIATYLVSTGSSQAREIAEAVLRQTVQNNPNSEQAMVNLAILFYMTARPAESAQLYQRVLEINPNNLVAINNFAWMLCEEQGKLQQALDLTERGLKIAPQYVDLIDTRGVIHYRRGEFDKAIEYFSKCLKLYPDTVPTKATCYFHLARALVKNGQDAKATEHLNQALDLHKKIKGLSPADQTEAQRLLEQLQKGS